ncbi:MAG: bifunctional 3-(3-hydroxy-phenyl)propionate/3-hydroxycinnamic acid hydroxylase [Hyphomicrobiales bacterium]
MAKAETFQVVVAGAGPTGHMLANLLGVAGVRTLIIEKNASTVGEPRAVSIDDEALRTAQAAGLVDDVVANVVLDYGSHYFTPSGWCFAKVEPTTREYGYPRRNAFRQPLLEATLRDGLYRFDHVEVRFENELVGFEQDGRSVHLKVRGKNGKLAEVTCDYLAACDGGRSFVRSSLEIPFKGSSFEQRWLIIDLLGTKDDFRHTRVFSNPDRPGISLPGPHTTRRFEFMLRDSETNERAESEEFARELLSAHGPDGDTEIVRRQVYTFHARIAERWREGRLFLLGDAAHLTPPFAGQGMNSGIRDAHNLAWKLASVLKGELGAELLESYQSERKPHAWALIELALTIGRVMVPRSKLHARAMYGFFDALSLCPPAKRYVTEMRFKPKPYYREGFLAAPVDETGRKTIGRMFPQPEVQAASGEQVLLDTLLGDGFAVVIYGDDESRAEEVAAEIDGLVKTVIISAAPGGKHCLDKTGALQHLKEGNGLAIFLIRPDRYTADGFMDADHISTPERISQMLERK